MFNKYIAVINSGGDTTYAARIQAKATEDLGKKLESISNAEIKSKDRVDISLEEYQTMTHKIEVLERKLSQMSKAIIALGIPYEVIEVLDPASIVVEHYDNPATFKRRYHIKFDVDGNPDMQTWR